MTVTLTVTLSVTVTVTLTVTVTARLSGEFTANHDFTEAGVQAIVTMTAQDDCCALELPRQETTPAYGLVNLLLPQLTKNCTIFTQ